MEYIKKKNDEYLMHYGVKGMKWGVRRAQKKYEKTITAAQRNVAKKNTSRYVSAYNKAADEWNNGKIEKFNKTHSSKSKTYMDDYENAFDKDVQKHYNKLLLDDVKQDKYYREAKQLAEKYSEIKASDFYKRIEKDTRELERLADE